MIKLSFCYIHCIYVCWQEAEIKKLEEEIATLQDPQKLLAEGVVSPALEALQNENAKLKYQINTLKKVGYEHFKNSKRLFM